MLVLVVGALLCLLLLAPMTIKKELLISTRGDNLVCIEIALLNLIYYATVLVISVQWSAIVLFWIFPYTFFAPYSHDCQNLGIVLW